MRLRSRVIQSATLAVALGSLTSASLGISRPPGRSITRQPPPAVTLAPNPAVLPPRNPPPSVITIDRVRYRVTCEVRRFTSRIADIDPTPQVTLTLRRVDGRLISQTLAPRLDISQSGVASAVTLARVENIQAAPEAVFTGPGDALWADDVQLQARLTVPQRRGVAAVTIRSVPFIIIDIDQPR